MNCTDINTHKDDYLNGNLSLLLQGAFDRHLSECKTCSDAIKGLKKVHEALNTLPVPEPSNGFVEGVFREVRRQHPKKSSNQFVAGFATAMAAGFALWFISTLFVVQQQSLPAPNEMTVSLNAAQSVRLMFDAPSNLEQVTLSIKLPENVELTGYSGQSELSWQTSFAKGQNILTLPIMAVEKGMGELTAQLNYGDKVKVFRLVIKTADGGVVNYQIKATTSV